MRLGDIFVTTLETGRFKLDGGAMFGTVPKTLWSKVMPADELNRILMALRVVLIRDYRSKRNLLIDTGIGTKWTEKLASIYAINHSEFTLETSLSQHGLTCDDITDVVLTHLHFDHAGGATRLNAGRVEASFRNARYYVQKENYEWAIKPNPREAASYLPENFACLKESGVLTLCDGVADLERQLSWPGFSARLSYGHTVGLQSPVVQVENKTFFYPSDLIPTSAHVPVAWTMGYDIHVIKLLEEKEARLREAVENKWIVIYEHDPVFAATTIVKGAKHFEAGDVVPL